MSRRAASLGAVPFAARLCGLDLVSVGTQLRNAADEATTEQDMVNALNRVLDRLSPITRDLEELRAIYTRRPGVEEDEA